jgi:beta-glucosidase
LAALGGNAYAFSTFWTRILPFGMKDTPVNEAGLAYYEDLVSYCHQLKVTPVM